METITYNGLTISVGDKVRVKNDTEQGTVKEIQKSGHFEEYRKYDLMICWDDDPERRIRTNMQYFIEVMEKIN